MASGPLPPAFPAIRIDGELYWDGGISFEHADRSGLRRPPRRNSLIFAVHMWNPVGPEPETIRDVLHRQKEIQYSSGVPKDIARQMEMHRLRHVIRQLVNYVSEEFRDSEAVCALAGHGRLNSMHVVRLQASRLDNEDRTKDVDFSPFGIRKRWDAGYADARRAVDLAAVAQRVELLRWVILHEPMMLMYEGRLTSPRKVTAQRRVE